jgi:hypothetical protein
LKVPPANRLVKDFYSIRMTANENEFAPVTPGEMLREEFLAEYALSQSQLAKALGISPNRIAEIVANRRRGRSVPRESPRGASSSSTRTAAAPACGYGSGTRRRVRFPLAFLAANNRNQPAPTTGADADSKTSSRDGVFGILVILRGNSGGRTSRETGFTRPNCRPFAPTAVAEGEASK